MGVNKMNKPDIEIYADGADVNEMIAADKLGFVDGLLQTTLMAKAGINDYLAFARSVTSEIKTNPYHLKFFLMISMKCTNKLKF